MKIIDSHMHLGDCRVFGCNVTEKELIENMDRYGVAASIVQPYPGADDEAEVHRRIYKLSQQNPGRIYALASVNPHINKEVYQSKIRKYVEEYGCVAVKIHTIGHAVHPMSADAKTVVQTAQELGIAVNIHTGPGAPFALPSLILPMAKEYPDTKFVLAHAGAGFFAGEAIMVAQQCPNVYLEMSWCSVEDVAGAIGAIGSQRVMFGSDSLMNVPTGLAVFRSLPLTEDQLEDVMWRTAANAFSLK